MATIPAETISFLTNDATKTTKSPLERLENANLASKTQDQQHEAINHEINKFKNMETVALVVQEPKADFKMTPVILDEVRDDEVLIEMKYSGICKWKCSTLRGLLFT